MIPISDDNPTLRTPVMTFIILGLIGAAWFLLQGAGVSNDGYELIASVCNLGMIPGELTGLAAAGTGIPLSEQWACYVDREPINLLTPVTSMFLHGGWAHLLGNALFLWVFGNNVEDSMGRFRFLVFYLACGLAAAAAHVIIDPSSPIPTVGASGAISGVMGAYLVLYPRVRVNILIILFIFIRIVPVPAWVVLLLWFGLQLVSGLPQLGDVSAAVSSGVAYWAHIGGFAAGLVLVKLFENRALVRERTRVRHVLHPDHP